MRVVTCIEDLRLLARSRVPRMFYDYVDSGSWTQSTYRERDLATICFRQHVAVNIEKRSIQSTMIGENVAMPVALAPAGLCGMLHADGEILAARAAEAFGVPFCLSTMSICSIEDVAATKPFWFQLYVTRNRGFIERLIGRAKEAQCSALMVTLDLPLAGQRHKDLRNGLFNNAGANSRDDQWCRHCLASEIWRCPIANPKPLQRSAYEKEKICLARSHGSVK